MRTAPVGYDTAAKGIMREWNVLVMTPAEAVDPLFDDDAKQARMEDTVCVMIDDNMESASGLGMGMVGIGRAILAFTQSANTSFQLGDRLLVNFGLDINGTMTYMQYGEYIVAEIETSNDSRSLTYICYDNAMLLADEYVPTITLPDSPANVLTDILTQAGITLQGSYTFPVVQCTAQTGTMREWIGWLAGLLGCNARITQTGKLEFVYYDIANPGDTIDMGDIFMDYPKYATDADITITGLVTGVDGSRIVNGSGRSIKFDNPFIDSATAASIYSAVNGMAFRPLQLKWTGTPLVECGDVLTIVDADDPSVSETVLCMHHRVVFDGGYCDYLDCYGKADDVEKLNVSPMRQAFETALQQAGAKITGNKGGYVVIRDHDGDGYPDELLILDTDSIDTATSAWRWNYAGLGFGSGSAGDLDNWNNWAVAITNDGQINATLMTTGTLTATGATLNNSNFIGDITAGGIHYQLTINNQQIHLYDATNNTTVVSIEPLMDNGKRCVLFDVWDEDAARIGVSTGNTMIGSPTDLTTRQTYMNLNPEYINFRWDDENASGDIIFQLRTDGAASAKPLPLNQGGTGASNALSAAGNILNVAPTFTAPTINTYASAIDGGYVQIGKVVFVQMSITTRSTSTSGSTARTMATGMPTPIGEPVALAISGATPNQARAEATIATNGRLNMTWEGSISSLTYRVSGVYICS